MNGTPSDPSDGEATRAARRRQTWSVQPLDSSTTRPSPSDAADASENWRRLEQLRRAACAMRGEPYPERSTREQRQRWPGVPIRG